MTSAHQPEREILCSATGIPIWHGAGQERHLTGVIWAKHSAVITASSKLPFPLPKRQSPKRGYYSIATELTDWDAFHKVTIKFQTSTLDAWNHSLRTAHRQTTKTVQCNEDNPQIDRHLVTLWDKRYALIRRWKLNELNKRFRARIEEITQEAQEYADKLATDNCLDVCEHAGNNLHTSRAWSLFRTLLGQPKRKNHLEVLQLKKGIDWKTLGE
ncbi:hypothetical protein HPB49_010293 [Dermacentor silvarum]|uniref:Uncharacterized protein n=1 Tax=Dermacentor silvarum TaxID=543639 RepID=A0ACB8CKG9_DERSI|nr:hypothetical protein HPB49_010293 [Dermacentor silvarum]